MNQMLKESSASGNIEAESDDSGANSEEWDGFPDRPDLDIVDHEEEYIDEDRYTTVTVESVSVTRDGLSKQDIENNAGANEANTEVADDTAADAEGDKMAKSAKRQPRKKKNFRYESKLERDIENVKQRARHKAKRR